MHFLDGHIRLRGQTLALGLHINDHEKLHDGLNSEHTAVLHARGWAQSGA